MYVALTTFHRKWVTFLGDMSGQFLELPCGPWYKSIGEGEEQSFTNPMAPTQYYWAVIGGANRSARVYGWDDW